MVTSSRSRSCLALLVIISCRSASVWEHAQPSGTCRTLEPCPTRRTDSTAAFQKALDAAAAGGRRHRGSRPPAGSASTAHSRFQSGVTLQGTYRVPPTADRRTVEKPDGTVLLAFAGRGKRGGPALYSSGRPELGRGRDGRRLSGMEGQPTCRRSPIRPASARRTRENVGILDCCLLNPYEGIKLVARIGTSCATSRAIPSKRGHLRRRVLRHRPHREHSLLAVRCGVQSGGSVLQVGEYGRRGLRTGAHRLALRVQHVLLRLRSGIQVLGVEVGCHQRQLPGARGRLVPASGVGRAGAAAGTVDHQRRIRGAVEQYRLGVRRDRPAGGRQGQPDATVRSGARSIAASGCAVHSASSPPTPATSSIGTTMRRARRPSSWMPARPWSKAARSRWKARTSWPVPTVRSAILIGNQAESGFRVDNQAGKRTQLVANEAGPDRSHARGAVPLPDRRRLRWATAASCKH